MVHLKWSIRGPVSDTHLRSLQHLPLVKNLHCEYFVSVFHLYYSNLEEEKIEGLKHGSFFSEKEKIYMSMLSQTSFSTCSSTLRRHYHAAKTDEVHSRGINLYCIVEEGKVGTGSDRTHNWTALLLS